MKVAIYARVSTDEQFVENQMPVLEAFCKTRGWTVVRVYQEEGSAWKAGRQRELAEMFKVASTHEIDVVLVWALDRLTREGPTTILNYMHTLKRHGVRLVSVQESWTEFPNEMTELFYAMVGWVAQFESKRKSERVKLALEKRRKAGLPVGRQKGSKDNPDKPRKRTGYLLRYVDRRQTNPRQNSEVSQEEKPEFAAVTN